MKQFASAAALCAIVAGCGSGFDSAALRKRVEARFRQADVTLHEYCGFYGCGGDDDVLAPGGESPYGDFAVHVIANAHGFQVAEATAHTPGPGGVRWDDISGEYAQTRLYTVYKRYGPHLELQYTTAQRTTAQPHWQQLDAIMRSLQ